MSEKYNYVSIPLDVLKALFQIAYFYPLLAVEVKELSRRLDDCYALTSECMHKISDLSRR